ncbi:MAG: peptidase S8, partial [Symploca sp. SIO2B6]|nr:peptidase S8 [Symploca sp. SIO2B6]
MKVSDLPGIPELWNQTLGTANVRVAILDGPVDQSHRCFDHANLTSLPSLVNMDESFSEMAGEMTTHGTHVTSLIFGQHDSA